MPVQDSDSVPGAKPKAAATAKARKGKAKAKAKAVCKSKASNKKNTPKKAHGVTTYGEAKKEFAQKSIS